MIHAIKVRLFRIVGLVPTGVRQWVVRILKPSYTLGASCLFHRDGDVLLVGQTYRSKWALPGGLLDRGEDPRDGVIREVREELGIDFAPRSEPTVTVDTRYRRIGFVYVEPLPEDLERHDVTSRTAEIDRVEWFDVDSMPALQMELSRSMQKLLAQVPPVETTGS